MQTKAEMVVDVPALKKQMKKTKNKSEFQRLQCLLLRVTDPEMTAAQIGTAVGLCTSSVWHIHSQYLHNHDIERFRETRGGRHRANMSIEEEEELLKPFLQEASKSQMVVVTPIKSAYEKKVGHEVAKSTIYRMLKRHGWRKIVPYKRHPKANKEEQEAFKKTSQLTLKKRLKD